jgi:hypothetical protein
MKIIEMLDELSEWMKSVDKRLDELSKWADDIDSRLCEVRIKHKMSPHVRGEKIE